MEPVQLPMNFEKHLFISYAHLDNEPWLPGQQGWVTRFHAALQAFLSMRLGRKAEIWRDSRLAGTDVFSREIVDQFVETAALVSVLTPRYIESEWCRREVDEFCKAADRTGGVVVDNKSRIVKVIKTPVDDEASLPEVMRGVLGYPFYTFDEDEAPLELDPAYGEELSGKYSLKLAKLAWEIAQLLKKLESEPRAHEGEVGECDSKPVIYLAECSYDRREARETLEAELRLHGYTVLPDRELPRQEDTYLAAVESQLGRCQLSIHLIGSTCGWIPEGPSQESTVALQNNVAIRQSKDRALKRLIWLPANTRSDLSRQQELIESLRNDADAQFGADVITGDLETLKLAVHSALKRMRARRPGRKVSGTREAGTPLVYMICDVRDRKATIPLRKLFKEQGFKVEIPLFEGDAAAIRQANRELLTFCEYVFVYYGSGSEAWRRTVEGDLRRMSSFRNQKPPPTVYTYLARPATDHKEELIELEEPFLVNGLETFPEAELRGLLRAGGSEG